MKSTSYFWFYFLVLIALSVAFITGSVSVAARPGGAISGAISSVTK